MLVSKSKTHTFIIVHKFSAEVDVEKVSPTLAELVCRSI